MLACCILLQTTALATNAIEPQASLYIAGTHVNITANSNGGLLISFSVSCLDEMTEAGATTIYLYEDNGNTEKCVKTYRCTDRDYEYILVQEFNKRQKITRAVTLLLQQPGQSRHGNNRFLSPFYSP